MIRYALSCDHGHGFEAWFGSSDDYDDQAARGLVECPFCASRAIAKQIMAPAVAGTKASAPSALPPEGVRRMMREAMGEVRRHVESTFEYVGDSFAREARDIHEGKAEERSIYGEATPQEARALREDGVAVSPLPPAPVDEKKLN